MMALQTTSVRERLAAALERGPSRSFAAFYRYLLEHPVEAALHTAMEMAAALAVDAATVVRASQHIGYSGWPELQKELRAHFRDQPVVRQVDRFGALATRLIDLRRELPDPSADCQCRDCRLTRLLDTLLDEVRAQFAADGHG